MRYTLDHVAIGQKHLTVAPPTRVWGHQVYELIFGGASSSESAVHPDRGGKHEFDQQL